MPVLALVWEREEEPAGAGLEVNTAPHKLQLLKGAFRTSVIKGL
jgi:hypothetical protein